MNWLITFAFVVGTMFAPNGNADAQKPQGAPPQAAKSAPTSGAGEILTAIDVAALILGGSTDADIAKSLSGQRGFDRETALTKGITDAQITRYLIIHKNPSDPVSDSNQALLRKVDGDSYYHKKEYDKAAREYTLAARHSAGKFEPYKLRADSYKQYLQTELNSASGSSSAKANPALLEKSRMLLCLAVNADYAKARTLNNQTLSDTVVKMNALRSRMSSGQGQYDATVKVDPTYHKSARQKIDMRQLRLLENQVRACKHDDTLITAAMSDSKQVCGQEDAARRQLVKTEREKARDKKWVRYGEKEEASYFYDKAGMTRSKDYLTVGTRVENNDNEKAYDTAKLRINCMSNTLGIIDRQSYDAIGNLASELHEKNPADKKVVKGSMEEMLLKEVCN
jgi:hypothetical protein